MVVVIYVTKSICINQARPLKFGTETLHTQQCTVKYADEYHLTAARIYLNIKTLNQYRARTLKSLKKKKRSILLNLMIQDEKKYTANNTRHKNK